MEKNDWATVNAYCRCYGKFIQMWKSGVPFGSAERNAPGFNAITNHDDGIPITMLKAKRDNSCANLSVDDDGFTQSLDRWVVRPIISSLD
jgi:hypothetical protein